jgi:hypothetical protein
MPDENRIDPLAAPKKKRKLEAPEDHKKLIITLGAGIVAGMTAATPFVSGPAAIGLVVGSAVLTGVLTAMGWKKSDSN